MPEVKCTECQWQGDAEDTDNDFDEGGEHMYACPECHAPTDDDHSQWEDPDDLSDTYGS